MIRSSIAESIFLVPKFGYLFHQASLADWLGIKYVFDVPDLTSRDARSDAVVAVWARSDKVSGEARVEGLDICGAKMLWGEDASVRDFGREPHLRLP
jgi:hypothetical protein